MIIIRYARILLVALLAGSCVFPYEIEQPNGQKYLVVEASLNDIDTGQIIRINETINFANNIYNSPVSNLKVELIINGSETLSLPQQQAGVYSLPESFKIQPGSTYKLRFEKPDGTVYESSEEKTTKVPTIDRIYDEFMPEGIRAEISDIPAHYIYLDFKDTPDETNYYLWTWKLWENQVICKTDYIDYYCNARCWEILSNKDFIVYNDTYSSGRPVSGKMIAKIPYYSHDGALLEVNQQAISEQVFRYFKLVSDQLQNTGTLVDTPPAAIIGNVKNIKNPNDPVTGVFSVTSSVKKRYWLSRENAEGKAMPVGLLGRKPYTPFFVVYPCYESPTRTPTQPQGWPE